MFRTPVCKRTCHLDFPPKLCSNSIFRPQPAERVARASRIARPAIIIICYSQYDVDNYALMQNESVSIGCNLDDKAIVQTTNIFLQCTLPLRVCATYLTMHCVFINFKNIPQGECNIIHKQNYKPKEESRLLCSRHRFQSTQGVSSTKQKQVNLKCLPQV